jgi:hypothetical protein
MQVQSPSHHLELPSQTRSKLEAFRRRVWIIKLAEGVLAAAFGLLVSYLIVFALDRIWDTPAFLRVLILISGALGLDVWLPLKWHRWVWRTRRLEQVARLLRDKFPRLGDQLLGVVELAQNELEQERSATLCRAAMKQVDAEISKRDFNNAVPNPRHRRWAWAAGVSLAIAATALVVVPAAGVNALARWLMPWKHTERYTFARIDDLPDKIVVPYAEPFSIDAMLSPNTAWSPQQASARFGKHELVHADLQNGGYTFALKPKKEPETLKVSVGNASQTVQVQPTRRPELTSMTAHVKLPDYLKYSSNLTKDILGGSLSLVKGSEAVYMATATRELASATVDGAPQRIEGNQLITESMKVEESVSREFAWRDQLGLSAKQPFVLSIKARDDDAPSISCSELSREQVVLDEEVLSFQVRTDDDFGVKSIGMEWAGVEDSIRNPYPAKGEKIISAGGPQLRELDADASFSAKREGVKPQTLLVRLFTVDYLPQRERTYSPVYVLHVLSPEEHAIWLTNRLRRWFRQAQDVYEREQQLLGTNIEIRELSTEEIDRPENRRRIQVQAAAESSNARRLSTLTGSGTELIKQATRNSQFNVATLESLAEMVQVLKDIAENRMPSVADLLKQGANAPNGTSQPKPGQGKPGESASQKSPPQVGENRGNNPGGGKPSKPGPPSKIPGIVDVESDFNEIDENQKQQDPSQSGSGRLTLPSTVIQGGGPKQKNQNQSCPANQKVSQAVEVQEDLLAEFAKVADELKRILNNLEASTFVKRLKAASRRQLELASDLNKDLSEVFGVLRNKRSEKDRKQADKLAEREIAQSENVYLIQDDLEAYYNRVQQGKFKTVLNEMKSTEVVIKLRDVSDTLRDNLSGQSIAQTEFWADTLDRWAEQLVGPG